MSLIDLIAVLCYLCFSLSFLDSDLLFGWIQELAIVLGLTLLLDILTVALIVFSVLIRYSVCYCKTINLLATCDPGLPQPCYSTQARNYAPQHPIRLLWYGALNEKCPHRVRYLKTWYLACGTVWGRWCIFAGGSTSLSSGFMRIIASPHV